MEHSMKLHEYPFNKILDGSKTIEIRLNDEKRRRVSVGDYITFSKLPTEEEQLKVQVIELYPYANFRELYEAFSFSEFGCEGHTMQNLLDETYKLWSEEQEEKCGALGIRIRLI